MGLRPQEDGRSLRSRDVYATRRRSRDDTAWDGAGNITDFLLDVTVSSIASKFINNKKYYALIIGNSNYDKWDDLVSPANDTKEIAKVLEEKYKFEVTEWNMASINSSYFKWALICYIAIDTLL